MPVSERLLEAIKKFEGFDANAYWDAYGKVWTIGWGRTWQVAQGDTTTREAEEYWLENYLGSLKDEIYKMLKVQITQLQEEALISFVFNVGIGALKGSTLLRKLNAGDESGAAREFDRWTIAGGVVLNGLIARRAEERRWFEAG